MIFASSVSKDCFEVQITEKALKTPVDLLGDGPGEPCSGDPRSLRVRSSPAGGPGSRRGRTGRGARKWPRENVAAAASRHLSASRRPLRWPLGVNTLLGRRFASSASWSQRGINPETGATVSGRGGGAQRGAGRGRPALARVGGGDGRAIAIHAIHSMYARVHRHLQTSVCSWK